MRVFQVVVLMGLAAGILGCGSTKQWHVAATFSGFHCVAARSSDETESRIICRNREGALECWNNSPRRFMYASFDDACDSARSAIEKAGKLP